MADYLNWSIGNIPGTNTEDAKLIGMFVEDISSAFFSKIAKNVERSMSAYKYKLFYASTENSKKRTRELIDVGRGLKVKGYIIAPPSGLEPDIEALIEDRVPVVLFDRYFPTVRSNNVIVDNFYGTNAATKHLLKGGRRHIGVITLRTRQNQMLNRLSGYRSVLEENDLLENVLLLNYAFNDDKLYDQISAFIKTNDLLDGIIFCTNHLAELGMRVLRDMEIPVPDQMAVVSFDDNVIFSLFKPSITAIAQPIDRIAEEIISLLLNDLNAGIKDFSEPRTVVLEPDLIIRNSSARVHKKRAIRL